MYKLSGKQYLFTRKVRNYIQSMIWFTHAQDQDVSQAQGDNIPDPGVEEHLQRFFK